jgi:creatinine amidohydrolase/Fe(II)-dependent formamide hydrolase-like protein
MEQNGPYLATGKHNYVNRAGCEAIARKLGNALCAPNVAFVPEGNFDPPSGALMYPGSIGVSDATFQALLSDIANSFRVTGFENVVLIGDSGGNQRGMKEVTATLSAKWAGGKTRIHYIADYYDGFNQVIEFAEKTFGWKQVPDGSHDDALITAIIMTVDPDHVRMPQRIAKGKTATNSISLVPVEKAVEIGKAIVNRRADITVAAIKKAIAGSR